MASGQFIDLFPSRIVALSVGGLHVYWYGVLYVAAFVLAVFLLPRLQHYRNLKLTRETWLELIVAGMAGVLIGGRVGYALFYEPQFFWNHPLALLSLANGGMSSHGGFVGVGLALLFISRHRRLDLWRLLDVATVPAALGLALGRMGNFINGELYGVATTLPWALPFLGADGLRHPTQLYAVAKDIFIAGVCWLALRRRWAPGLTTALFLILYSVLRFLLEFVRVQDYPLLAIGHIAFSRGQLLTIPIFFVGVAFAWYHSRR